MNKEMLLLLQKNIEAEKENTKQLFKEKLEQLRSYQKETLSRLEKFKQEYFPKEIEKMLFRSISNGHESSISYWNTISIDNKRISFYVNENHIEKVNFENRKISYKVKTKIEDWWCSEPYRSYMTEYKSKLDMLNIFLDFLESNIEELYSYIACEIKKQENEKRERNNAALKSLSNTVKKEEKKESKKVRIIIEVEE